MYMYVCICAVTLPEYAQVDKVLNMYVCVYMCVCICMCVYVCMYRYVCICMCVYVR